MIQRFILLFILLSSSFLISMTYGEPPQVVVEKISPPPENPIRVTRDHRYRSMVTLYIQNDDGTKTFSGWSTRQSDGAPEDQPFEFQPGVNLIEGWTQGVLEMMEGERALLYVPPELGYGDRPMGRPGGAFYIPAASKLLFDIEILGKVLPKETPDL